MMRTGSIRARESINILGSFELIWRCKVKQFTNGHTFLRLQLRQNINIARDKPEKSNLLY